MESSVCSGGESLYKRFPGFLASTAWKWGRRGMGMSVRLGRRRLRDVSVAVGILLASRFGSVAVSIETAGVSVAQSAQTRIDIQGNRRVEADTIRSYFKVNGAEHLDSAKIDAALKA